MDLDDWLYEDACQHLDFGKDRPFRSLDIWSFWCLLGHLAPFCLSSKAGMGRRQTCRWYETLL
jgi:hypothetical protein